MYGMIHCAVRDMVIGKGGHSEWTALERESEITPAEQITLKVYDDAVTMRIINAAAKQMGVELTEFLAMLGRHWIKYSSQGSFSSVMKFTGDDIITFLANLDQMHRAVARTMPAAQMPSFQIIEKGERDFKVRYRSEREGLEDFVSGLLEGLLEYFQLAGNVELVGQGASGMDFHVNYCKR